MKRLLVMAVAVSALSLWAGPKCAGKLPLREIQVRDGIGHVMEKIRAGKEVAVAYFGGSITEMEGWRTLSFEWLQKEYPQTRFRMIDAALGGTTSALGVFRLGADVIEKKPDLVFIEFTSNDRGLAPEKIWENYDGIVRQLWKANPTIDIVCVYTVTERMLPDYRNGQLTDSQSATEMIADHYGLPAVAFGVRIMDEMRSGRLVMSVGVVKELAPTAASENAKQVIARLAKEGKMLFAEDGVHPTMQAHGLYLDSLRKFWKAIEDKKPIEHAAKLARPYHSTRMESAKTVRVDQKMLHGNWRALPRPKGSEQNLMWWFEHRVGQLWQAENPGDSLCFKFRGTTCKIFDLMGPNGAYVKIKVDGTDVGRVKRFDSYCIYHRLSEFPVYDGPDGIHSVELVVDEEMPARDEILSRHPNADLSADKYRGRAFILGKIELIGDVIRDETVDPFSNGERISFLGDSITHGGAYHVDLQLYWDLRHPGSGVRLMNCGVSGESAGGGLSRWTWDVKPQRADRTFVMFGMNDVERDLYAVTNADIAVLTARSRALGRYEANMSKVLECALVNGRKIVVMTPTPFDQYGRGYLCDRLVGCNEPGLSACARICRMLAGDFGADIVELHRPLTEFMKREGDYCFCDPKDRVHPKGDGHLIIMAEILKAMGEPSCFGGADVDAALKSELEISYKAEILPFPVTEEYLSAEKVYPLTDTFNREMLTVRSLPPGRYDLTADGEPLGTFTDLDLLAGVNLALLPTPGAKRSQEAWMVSRELLSSQERLRDLVFIEATAAHRGADRRDFDAVCRTVEACVGEMKKERAPWAGWYAALLDEYKTNKSREAEFRSKEELSRKRLGKIGAGGVAYAIRIKRLPTGSVHQDGKEGKIK